GGCLAGHQMIVVDRVPTPHSRTLLISPGAKSTPQREGKSFRGWQGFRLLYACPPRQIPHSFPAPSGDPEFRRPSS
uniref:Uncharacterized protein n=1 Tax=Aegilops tauschii subsp. strangulata TaxID=200361 RepID=A0A452YS79_AEGTS